MPTALSGSVLISSFNWFISRSGRTDEQTYIRTDSKQRRGRMALLDWFTVGQTTPFSVCFNWQRSCDSEIEFVACRVDPHDVRSLIEGISHHQVTCNLPPGAKTGTTKMVPNGAYRRATINKLGVMAANWNAVQRRTFQFSYSLMRKNNFLAPTAVNSLWRSESFQSKPIGAANELHDRQRTWLIASEDFKFTAAYLISRNFNDFARGEDDEQFGYMHYVQIVLNQLRQPAASMRMRLPVVVC